MKKAIGAAILSKEFQLSVWGAMLRAFIRATNGTIRYSPQFLLDSQAIARPHYAYCMLNAARLASRLGVPRISAIEFGVAGGNGLAFMCDFAAEVKRSVGVEIECYGFDTGIGMPPPEGPLDLPYWFREAQYRMDEPALRARIPDGRLVIGDVRATAAGFLDKHAPAPIGVMFQDMDYWSSTQAALSVLAQAKGRPERFLPRLFMYFDDIIGGEIEMYGPFNGQLAAIAEFNAAHADMKVHLNQNLLPKTHLAYRHQIYYAHLFEHPRYAAYVGGQSQESMESLLKLQPA